MNNTQKENRSVARTQKLLKDGLLELMKTKPIQKISVKELTDYVNLNRGTFYLHYCDIYALLESLENDMLAEFLTINSTYTAKTLNGRPFPLILDLCRFLKKNEEFSRIMLIENRDQNFVDKLKNLLRDRCMNDWNQIFSKAEPEICDFYSSYILSGCIGMIENWFRYGAVQPPEQIAQYAEDIMLHGLEILK